MDIMNVFNDVVSYAKDQIDSFMDFWDNLSEDKKRLLVVCAVSAVAVIAVASCAYALGKCKGRKLAFEDEDF